MSKLFITLSEQQLQRLTEEAITADLTIGEFVLDKLFPNKVQSNDSQSYYMKKLIGAIQELTPGQTFIIRDLLPLDWCTMGTSAAFKLGRKFRKMVNDNEIPTVVFSHKAPDNSTVYQKTILMQNKTAI